MLVQLKLKLIHIRYRTDLHIEVRIRILLKDEQEIVSNMRNLQPYSHYCFSKISRTSFDFLNNTYWVSLFLRKNSLIFRTGVSCFSVTLFYFTLFCCGGKANLVRLTLFYSTLLTLTHRRNDGQRVTLILCGLGNQKKMVPPG